MNRSTHVYVGLAVGVLTELVFCRATDQPIEFRNVVLSGFAGAVCAALPDVLEPALNPNHRGFCHSGVAVVGVVYGLNALVSGATATTIPTWAGALARGALVGYGSHLVLDATTPKSLPLSRWWS